ncbi:MAG: hypothetical protein LUF85_17900 [Bacteroides sp.]|nr:hypothetical protein [Bacteroides sp.]
MNYDEETGSVFYSSTAPIIGYFSEETMSITLETGIGFLASQNGSLAGWLNAWKQGTVTFIK